MTMRLKALLMAGLMACFSAVHATPVLMLDMDPSTPGIQTSFTATEGDSLSFNLVAYDNGDRLPPLFPTPPPGPVDILVDFVTVDLGLSGTGAASIDGASTGAFGLAMGGIDFYDTMPLAFDPTLAAGFPFDVDGIGSFSYFGAPTALSIASDLAVETMDLFDVLIEYTFTADTAGIVDFSILGAPPGAELFYTLAPTGGPLFPDLGDAVLTILSSTPPPTGMPEPTTLLMMTLGLAAMVRRKKAL